VEPSRDGNGVDLDALFTVLGREHVLQALVEGGAQLHGSLLRDLQFQRLVAYVAPTVLGTGAVPGFAFAGPPTLADATRLTLTDVTRLGPDVRLEYEAR
jgi:diaminohydroxyphosphoribosylaminopyrimidine deaminase / 5-amino-6-(5-phosphoribosylamino)uracil reductase